jgi:hypothetical protein
VKIRKRPSRPPPAYATMVAMRFLVLLLTLALAMIANPTGQWTASIDTQIGEQNYTYTFAIDGEKLTGTAEIGGKKYEIRNGRFVNGTLTFLELFEYAGMEIPIEYSGKLTGDEIRFTRKVAEFATEEFTAKRAK